MTRALVTFALVMLLSGAPGSVRADVTAFFGTPVPCAGSVVTVPAPTPSAPDPVSPSIPEARSTNDPETAAAAVPASSEPAPSRTDAPPADSDEPPATVLEGATAESSAVPTAASSRSPDAAPSCTPIEFVRVGDASGEHAALVLVDCDGAADALSLRELSLLARPSGENRPTAAVLTAHESDLDWVAPRIRRLDAGLLTRIRAIADRFPGRAIEIVSGYRPNARSGSRHRFGRALDLRVRGVEVAALDAFARTLEATGIGLYPTTDFIHVDVRARSAHWVDVSGPGEAPVRVREPAAAAPIPVPARSELEPEPEPEVDAAAIGREAAALLDGFTIDLHRRDDD